MAQHPAPHPAEQMGQERGKGGSVRSRGGGVLSASALVALGTSVLLVALIGLGLRELASPPGAGASGPARTEAAAVVVPALTVQRHVAAGKHRRPATSPRPSIPVLTPS